MIEFQHVFYTYDAAPQKKKRRKSSSDAAAEAADWGNKPDAFWALQDVSFTLQDGEFLGLAGHTGSGKSTLIQHMNGLLHPTRGQVLVNGTNIADNKSASIARSNVGLVFQYPEHQLFAATVYEDVAFGPRNKGLGADEVDARVHEALAEVGLDFDRVSEASPFELSGGQQRRVAFAGVLAMHPSTLILDEPVAGLDPESRESFLELIEHLRATDGLTVVMVSHNMDDLARFSDRILALNTGRVFELDTPAEVFRDAEALKSIGLGVPQPQHLANTLRAAGINVPEPSEVYTIDTLADVLARAYRERQA